MTLKLINGLGVVGRQPLSFWTRPAKAQARLKPT